MADLVLDLTRLLPGPLCGKILAALGYRVLRLVPPAGDWMETFAPQTHAWLLGDTPRATPRETLDLKSDAGRDRLRALAAEAAVLLENGLPGRMEAWGVGPDHLRALNPKLVYVRLAGFRAPEAATQPGHDLTYLAAAGLLPVLDPAWRQLPLADLCGAFWAALAVERGLRLGGGYFDVHLEDAAWPAAFPRISGLDGTHCRYAVYPARGGRVALAALEPHLWERFCRAAAHADWLPHATAPAAAGEPVYDALCAWFQGRSAEAWERWALAAHLPLRAVRG